MNDLYVGLFGVIISIVGIIISLLLVRDGRDYVQNIFLRILGRPQKQQHIETYSEKMSRLTENLLKSSSEMDKVLNEINVVSEERADALENLEKQLVELSIQEKQVKERISTLEKVPLEAIAQLEKIIEKGDKRSALRDYQLFFIGVLVSTVITIILKLLGF